MNKQRLLLFLFLLLMVQACGLFQTSRKLSSSESVFQLTEKAVSELVDSLTIPAYLEGKARVLYASPQGNERLSVEFSANKDVCFMQFKNSIGIEAVHLWIDADSVTEYNKIEKTLIRMSKHDFAASFSGGLVPFHLFDVFFPERLFSAETVVLEDEYQWNLRDLLNGLEGFITKKNAIFTNIVANDQVQAFSQIEFSEHASLKNGRFIARKMEILIKPTSTRVLIGIIDFRESEQKKEINITLPKNVSLERL